MKIRTKLFLLAVVFSIGALVFAGLGMATWKRVRLINESIQKGIEMQVRSRDVHSLMKDMVFDLFVPKIYGQLKSYTYSPRANVTVKKWKSAVLDYDEAFTAFMESESLLGIRSQDLTDQYETANTMHDRAMERLEELEQSINMISERVSSVGDNRFHEILGDEAYIPFFAEFRDTSYYFVDSFESFMDYFIKEFRAYADQLQRRAYIMYTLVAVFTALAGIFISLYTAKDIIKKIKRVEQAFERVSKGDFSDGMEIHGHDEFSELADQFNALSIDLKENVENILLLTRVVGRSISQDTSMEDLMKSVASTLVVETRADFSLIHFLGTDPSVIDTIRVKKRIAEGNMVGVYEKNLDSLIQKVLSEGKPLLLDEQDMDESLPLISTLMLLPLVIDKSVMGTLTVGIHKPAPPFTDLGVTRLTTFSEFASLIMDNHLKYAELIKKGEAEYQALQSQVQPHFIYNVLNGIIGLNRMGAKQDLETTIIELKDMLRYTQDSRTESTISEEFSFVENYFQLQKLRFGDRITYSLHIDEGLEQVKIPRLLLQPLAENAVIHGIEPMDNQKGHIQLEAFNTLEDSRMVVTISISDNGVGCDLDDLQELEHIGIGNVKKRFKYAFPNAAFNVKSSPGKGTEVRMTFYEMYHS
ncbi:MAG: histidine kinase [Spirochaetia bacterium]|nr:histidine kinase [Spirochaetia bacterium]